MTACQASVECTTSDTQYTRIPSHDKACQAGENDKIPDLRIQIAKLHASNNHWKLAYDNMFENFRRVTMRVEQNQTTVGTNTIFSTISATGTELQFNNKSCQAGVATKSKFFANKIVKFGI